MNANLKAVEAAKLSEKLADATPAAIVAEALHSVGSGRVAVASSFGIESATLLKIVADVDPSIPVVFLDTGWLFPETLAYRDTLVARLGAHRRAHHRAISGGIGAEGSEARSLGR